MITAAILKKKKKISIEYFKIPTQIRDDQVLVKIKYAGICGSQIMEYLGKRGEDRFLPHAFGHEASGIVVKTGSKVKKVKKNDYVILSWIKGCGLDNGGFILENNDKKKINFGPISTFSSYALISENRVFKKPSKMTELEAALYGCAIPTGVGIVLNELKNIKKNSKVCLIGTGGIGIASLFALLRKKVKIFVVEKNPKKKHLLKKYNIKFIDNENLKIYFNKFDYCIEASGDAKMIEYGFNCINNKGTLVFASHPEKSKKILIDPHDLIKGKKIIGTWGGGCNLDKDINKIFNLFEKKNIFSENANIKFYKLSQIEKAIKEVIIGKINRAMIKFG